MNRCPFCRRLMGPDAAVSCTDTKHIHYPDGTALPALPYTPDCLRPYAYPAPARCGDCGVAYGGLHHPTCCLEDCPRCGWQLLSCDCFQGDDDTQRYRPSHGPTHGTTDLTRALRDPEVRHRHAQRSRT